VVASKTAAIPNGRLSLTPLLGLILLLAGCAAGSYPTPSIEELKLAYADEPYEVRIVNRAKFDKRFHPTIVPAPEGMPEGSILVDTRKRFLYLIEKNGIARRYGVAVGTSGHAWSGTAVIGRKAKWPAWYPTDDMRNETPDLPQRIEPGPHNPLGARALYLYQNGHDTLYRIHGTSEPWTIGTEASSGCIRMLNEDVIDLFDRVQNGAVVKVI
jgi:lipoprotein-anchoring transpeptidase ErfK/SrfK